MEHRVVISIEGKQSFPGSEPEVVQTETQGTLEDRGEAGLLLTYREEPGSGLEGTRTTLLVEPRRVTLERTGTLTSQMVFEEGQEHRSAYATPYGALALTVRTHKLHTHLDARGGEVTIYYDLELDRAGAGRNMLRLQVRPAM